MPRSVTLKYLLAFLLVSDKRGEHLLPLGELKKILLDSFPPFGWTDFLWLDCLLLFIIDLGDLLVGNSYGTDFLTRKSGLPNRLIFLRGAF